MGVLKMAWFRKTRRLITVTFNGFINDNGLKLSASLAYYTVFAIAPLIILMIAIASLILQHFDFNDTLYHKIYKIVGQDLTIQIRGVVDHILQSGKTGVAFVTSIFILLLGASSVFIDIQDSLNMIWRVKAKPKNGWLKLLKNRFLSFSLIIILGFLLLVCLIFNIAINSLSRELTHILPGISIAFFDLINLTISLVIIALLFGIMFKYLPDAKLKWHEVRAGALFTAILFILGQYLIGIYFKYSAVASTYGAAGSLIALLVWIYYTSAILYIGAEFTKAYGQTNQNKS